MVQWAAGKAEEMESRVQSGNGKREKRVKIKRASGLEGKKRERLD